MGQLGQVTQINGANRLNKARFAGGWEVKSLVISSGQSGVMPMDRWSTGPGLLQSFLDLSGARDANLRILQLPYISAQPEIRSWIVSTGLSAGQALEIQFREVGVFTTQPDQNKLNNFGMVSDSESSLN